MSVNTPSSWSMHALRKRLGMLSRPTALRGLTYLNDLLTSATEDGGSQSTVAVVSGISEERFEFVREQDVSVRDVDGFPFIIRDYLESLPHKSCV
jgi:hypothetical protein